MRLYKRIPAKQEVFYISNSSTQSGTILNCSETGMYIETKVVFPFDLIHEILIPYNFELIKVPVRVVRLEKKNKHYVGVGVEVLHLSSSYFEFLTGLLYSKTLTPAAYRKMVRQETINERG